MRKFKLTLEQCVEIRKELLEGCDTYLLSRKYRVSITTIENANRRALALEKGLTWEEIKRWKKNAFAYDKETGKPNLG